MYYQWSEIWRISILPNSNKVEQLTAEIRALIKVGTLSPGSRMPPIRDVAKRLKLGNGTVRRAYYSLQTEGLLASMRAGGTFVSSEMPFVVEEPRVNWPDHSPYSFSNHKTILSVGETAGTFLISLRDLTYRILPWCR